MACACVLPSILGKRFLPGITSQVNSNLQTLLSTLFSEQNSDREKERDGLLGLEVVDRQLPSGKFRSETILIEPLSNYIDFNQ